MNDTLVVEISGKRPGNASARPTEKFNISYPHIIISNNSEGYETDWEIVNVPDGYKNWYMESCKQSKSAWYAPMNRSYAIKYAREHGYKYLIQLDDNIKSLEISYRDAKAGRAFRVGAIQIDDFIHALVTVLENSDAMQSGMRLNSCAPDNAILAERYCYSFFAVNVDRCPDVFQGDFEDDIEFRLKMRQMGGASICICPFGYTKTSQGNNKDASGNRQAYIEAGLQRGEHMRKLYGDVYTCGMSEKRVSTMAQAEDGVLYFKHKIRPFKVGCMMNTEPIYAEIKRIMQKYHPNVKERHYVRQKKVKNIKNYE